MATIAPWLQPQDFLGAIRAGAGLGLQLRQQQSAEQQAAERLRQADQELFQQAQQQEMANQLKAAQFEQEQERFRQAQERQQRMDLQDEAAAKAFAEGLAPTQPTPEQYWQGTGGQGPVPPGAVGKPDILKATAAALQTGSPSFLKRIDPDALQRAISADQQTGGMSRGLMTYYAQLGANTGENILDPTVPGGVNQDALNRATQKMGGEGGIVQKRLQTSQQKNASDYETWLTRTYPDKPKSEIEAEVKRYSAGGPQAVKAPEFVIKDAIAGDKVIVGLDNMFNQIQQFNSTYGDGEFEKYIGPWEGRLTAIEKKFGRLDSAKKQQLQGILSSIEQIKQAYKLSNFGTALSAGERADFKNIVETPTSNAFIPTLNSFRNTTRNLLQNTLNVYPDAPNIPPVLRQRYFGGGGTEKSVGKYKIISIGQ